MEEEELKKLEDRYRKETGKDPSVSIPPGGAYEDVPEFVKRAALVKVALHDAKKRNDFQRIAHLQGTLEIMKRVVRARAIQRELNRVEGKVNGYLTPWPEIL